MIMIKKPAAAAADTHLFFFVCFLGDIDKQ